VLHLLKLLGAHGIYCSIHVIHICVSLAQGYHLGVTVIVSVLTMIVIYFFSLTLHIVSFFQLSITCDIQLLFLTSCILFFSLINVRIDLLNTGPAGCHVMQSSRSFNPNLSSISWHFCSSTKRLVVNGGSLAAFIVGNDRSLDVFISTYCLSIVFRCIKAISLSVITLGYILQLRVVRDLRLILF